MKVVNYYQHRGILPQNINPDIGYSERYYCISGNSRALAHNRTLRLAVAVIRKKAFMNLKFIHKMHSF
jgi:hypothetical protein